MATWKSTPEQRAQAAQLVLKRVEDGATLADSIRHFALALEVSESTLRGWVRAEKSNAEADAAPVVTAVLDHPEPASEPEPAPYNDTLDVLFEQSRAQSSASARNSGWKRVAAGVAAVVAFLIAGGVVNSFQDSPKEKAQERISDYLEGKSTREFVGTDSNFRATFPFGMPQRQTESETIEGITLDFIVYSTESGSGAYSIGSFALPAGAPFDLNGAVNGSAAATDAEIVSATPITFQGFPAIEFVFRVTEGGISLVDKGFWVNAGTRAYVLQTLWEDAVAPGYEEFKTSFHIGI